LRVLLLRPEHRIGQRDGIDVAGVGVARDVGIDEEGDREILTLAGIQVLAREAEALDLGEIEPDLGWRDVVGRRARDPLARFVDRVVGNGALLAGMHLHRCNRGAELPGKVRGDIGIEPHGDQAVREFGARRFLGALCRAVISGHRAKEAIERHRRDVETDHDADHAQEGEHGDAVAPPAVRRHQNAPSLTSVTR
jgi:hypothetical protein